MEISGVGIYEPEICMQYILVLFAAGRDLISEWYLSKQLHGYMVIYVISGVYCTTN